MTRIEQCWHGNGTCKLTCDMFLFLCPHCKGGHLDLGLTVRKFSDKSGDICVLWKPFLFMTLAFHIIIFGIPFKLFLLIIQVKVYVTSKL